MDMQHKLGDSKFMTKKSEIAAAGNRPEDWKAYIEEFKLSIKDLPSDDEKKYHIISYLYYNAFKVIPVSNNSLAHAQLLVDYALFKSEHSLDEAEKLMSHGRRYLRMHAIIHVASAELELKKGDRQKAATILRRGGHYGAKPEKLIREAKDRLNKDCRKLLHGDSKENESFDSSSGNSTSGDHSGELTGEPRQSSNKQTDNGDNHTNTLPGCKFNTEEMQQGLDLISHYRSSATTPSHLSTHSHLNNDMEIHSTQESNLKGRDALNLHLNNDMEIHSTQESNLKGRDALNPHHMPDPPQLPSRPFQDLGNTSAGSSYSKRDNSITSDSLVSDLSCENPFPLLRGGGNAKPSFRNDALLPDRTPQGLSRHQSMLFNSAKVETQGSAMKFNRWHSASSVQQPNKLTASTSKIKVLNLPPPQRVRMDHHSSSEDSDEDDKVGSKSMKNGGSSSSLTLGKSMSQRSLWNVSSKNSGSSLSTPYEAKHISDIEMGHASNMKCEELSRTAEGNRGKTFQVPKASINRIVSNIEKISACDSGVPSSTGPISQETPPQYGVRPEKNVQTFEMKKSALPSKERMALQEEIQQLPSVRKSEQEPACSRLKEVDAPLVSAAASQVAKPSEHQQVPVRSAVGATYSVPAQNPNQGNSNSLVTPAKQTVQGDKRVIHVKGKPYNVIKLLGRGGSAKVYQVQDPETLNMMALKSVNLSCVNREVLEGYKNEIALLEKLQHCDRVIKLYSSEYVSSQKKLFVVMECGETNLADFIAQHTKNKDELHTVTICYLWGHMVKAVQAMHKEGVIHSDLKPANFILVSGTIKLIDFGIANSIQQDKTSVLKNHVMGTPNYMSPETLMASNADSSEKTRPEYKVGTRSDVWSLGCILYQMVYGHTPFQHVRFKMEAIVNPAHEIQFPPLSDDALMDILKKCLTRDVKLRPTTDDLMNHPYLTKQKLVKATKPSNPLKETVMKEEDISSASPRTLHRYYLKKAEEFKTMASSLVTKMDHKEKDFSST